MDDVEYFITGAIIFAIAVGLFFLLRTLVLWYYRINEKIENQLKVINQNKTIIRLLEEINENLQNSIIDQVKIQKDLKGAIKKTKKDATITENEED